uniref:Uncharacterized protein n=1 Tax=Arundo donax TaxID=35708 RepID=A0A0A9FZK8_ARUDO
MQLCVECFFIVIYYSSLCCD